MLQGARILGALAHLNSHSKSISVQKETLRVAAFDTAVLEKCAKDFVPDNIKWCMS